MAIWLGTHLFGHTEIGVRLGLSSYGFLLPWATYLLSNRCGLKSSTSFWAGTLWPLSPLGILSSLFATTVGGYVLFGTLGFAVIISAIESEITPNYARIWIMRALRSIVKWTSILPWLVVLAVSLL